MAYAVCAGATAARTHVDNSISSEGLGRSNEYNECDTRVSYLEMADAVFVYVTVIARAVAPVV